MGNIVKQVASVTVLGVVLFALQIFAFSEPVQAPPNCPAGSPGCSAPLNIGPSAQTKSGDLTVHREDSSVPPNAIGVITSDVLRVLGGAIINENGTDPGNALLIPYGRVGIGTLAPTHKVDVVGDVHASGDICTDVGGTCLGNLSLASLGGGAPSWSTIIVDSGGGNNVGQYSDVVAVNPNVIYISYFDATLGRVKVAKSADAGQTWKVSSFESVATGPWTSIDAADPNTVYVSYYKYTAPLQLRVAKSVDGGRSWSIAVVENGPDTTCVGGGTATPGSYSSIDVVDANTVFVSYNFLCGGFNSLKVEKTTNGGSTWTQGGSASIGIAMGQYSSLRAFDANNIFVSGLDSLNNSLAVLRSSNGGLGFSYYTGLTTGVQWTSVDAVSPTTIFATAFLTASADLVIYKSNTGGTSWNAVSPAAVDTAGNVGQYNSLKAVNENTLFIAYYDATETSLKIAKSTVGGQGDAFGNTWTYVIPDLTGTVGQWSNLSVLDANHVYISYYDATNAALKLASYH